MSTKPQIEKALVDLHAAEQARKHQLAVETLAQAKYLRERGNLVGAYAVVQHAVSYHGLNALQKQVDKAKEDLAHQYGWGEAQVIANRAAIAATRAVKGGDCAQLAREVAGVVPSARKLPVVPDVDVVKVSEARRLAA